MSRLVLFNKPFDVLSQFTDADGRRTLADYIELPGVYPAGRLDRDSEGLLLLTDDGRLAHTLTEPRKRTWKTYLVQVEGEISDDALEALRTGVDLKDGRTRPARARRVEEPDIWRREPPVRYRAHIPTSWLQLQIREGRNRQVRRMTAAVGFPTLRLIRIAVGRWSLEGIAPGDYRLLDVDAPPPDKPRAARRQAGKARRRR